jgi:enterochelin esterase family protein
MEKLKNTNLWYISCKIRNDIRFQYCFSVNDSLDDDWDARFEKIIHDTLNKNFLFIEDEEENEILSYVVMPNAKEHIWLKENEHTPKGTINEFSFKSENLEEHRRIRVYTPHGYEKTNKPYKFLVLTDGDEYLNVLSVKPVLDNLIAEKRLPPIVVLFIDSTDTREEELTCSDTFVDIVAGEFIPWFRENYNVSLESSNGIIGGLSLGGLTAAYIGLKHSEIFGNVLSQSGSFWYKPEECKNPESACWISSEFKKIEKLPLKFYLNVGILEEKDNMIGVNKILRNVLKTKGYEVDYEEFKGGHDYLCWGENLANGLISLIGIK